MNLHNRVALVTGGARRVGRAISLGLARAGADVALHYRSSAQDAHETASQCRALGVAADVFLADLADPAACESLVARVIERFGRLDVLVNNASEFEPMSLDDFRIVDWERTLRVNLTAPVVLAHAARAQLRANRGRIVNLCDTLTARPPGSHLAYIASKGALDTVTRALARDLAPEVNVVGVAPGVADWPPDYSAELRRRITDRIPLRRAGTPDDIAAAVVYLVTAGDYVTGAILAVDGGFACG